MSGCVRECVSSGRVREGVCSSVKVQGRARRGKDVRVREGVCWTVSGVRIGISEGVPGGRAMGGYVTLRARRGKASERRGERAESLGGGRLSWKDTRLAQSYLAARCPPQPKRPATFFTHTHASTKGRGNGEPAGRTVCLYRHMVMVPLGT